MALIRENTIYSLQGNVSSYRQRTSLPPRKNRKYKRSKPLLHALVTQSFWRESKAPLEYSKHQIHSKYGHEREEQITSFLEYTYILQRINQRFHLIYMDCTQN